MLVDRRIDESYKERFSKMFQIIHSLPTVIVQLLIAFVIRDFLIRADISLPFTVSLLNTDGVLVYRGNAGDRGGGTRRCNQ